MKKKEQTAQRIIKGAQMSSERRGMLPAAIGILALSLVLGAINGNAASAGNLEHAQFCIVATSDKGKFKGEGGYCPGLGDVAAPAPTTPTPAPQPTEEPVPAFVSFKKIAAAGTSTVGLGVDGKLYAWGKGVQLGRGKTTDSSSTPTLVPTPGLEAMTFTDLIAQRSGSGGGAYFARGVDGKFYSWGTSYYGAAAQGGGGSDQAPPTLTPKEVAAPAGVKFIEYISEGYLRGDDGNLYAWGDNKDGSLCTGSVTTRITTPTLVLTGENGAKLSPSGGILKDDSGNFYLCGNNINGDMANGLKKGSQLTPHAIKLPNGEKVASATARTAISTTGNYYVWGMYSQLNSGSNFATPTRVAFPEETKIVGRDAFGNLKTSDGRFIGYVSPQSEFMSYMGRAENYKERTEEKGLKLADYRLVAGTTLVADGSGQHYWFDGVRYNKIQIPSGVYKLASTVNSPINDLPPAGKPKNRVFLIGSDGVSYAFGDNRSGALGTGGAEFQMTPAPIINPLLVD